jgi:hypothetical protein
MPNPKTWNKRKVLQEYRALRFTTKALLEMLEDNESDPQTVHEHMQWVADRATLVANNFTPAKLKRMFAGAKISKKSAA